MCEADSFEADLLKYENKDKNKDKYSRRDLGKIAAIGTGAAFFFPRLADGAELQESDVVIATPDGQCDAYFVSPAEGKHAAVLVWPDIFGLRGAFRQMGQRLAQAGYSVLVVNPFYRQKKAPTAPQGTATPFAEITPLARALTPQTHVTDAKAFIAWLDTQQQVDATKKIGTIGYCMGGAIVFRTAAALPDRIGAGCSFHGGGLVTENSDSPHLLIPQMKAQFLVAIAENDDERAPQAKEVLKKSFTDAKLQAEIEVYPAAHGWCPPDTRVYNEEQAEKAWGRMLDIFKSSLS